MRIFYGGFINTFVACFLMVNCNKRIIESGTFDQQVISFSSNGVKLEGTLELPASSEGPYPLMVFVHGSGRQTRNSYQSYANRFLPKGFAIFRYDKRGVGASAGVYSGVGPANSSQILHLLAEDANAAIQQLKTFDFIDFTEIILIGASQAGWIIPVAATLSNDVAMTIIIVGPTMTVGEEIFYSDLTANPNLTDEEISQQLANFSGLKGFDPVPFIGQMNNPGLWIFGGKDRSIPSHESMQILESIIQNDDKPFTIELFPDANHGMINQQTGAIEDFLGVIDLWLAELAE